MNRRERERTRVGRRVDGTLFERVAAAVRVQGGVRETVSLNSFDDQSPRFRVYRLDDAGVVVPKECAALARGIAIEAGLLRRAQLEAAADRTCKRAILRANPAAPAVQFNRYEVALLWAIEEDDYAVLQATGHDPVAVLDMDSLPIPGDRHDAF
ncbi:hypothetical protein EJ074_27975 [Mesorhizobium sp. M3A.F.Ca.ET.080.04.2.1]|uniref:hypothetical protein n=1 Tax=Mesorhizobium sp. M3A.F.Ca.ET.080.04.2.1 TaxID=2493676 RepID=UPI000F762CB1|nr:hypothetical protein [Mesorhizobium sp. M3A.F.Ca.ET.080.04.2.1]AZO12534.1 hypothetical protein EJ074_27975 [Mesorhizobium sp. M3A.F.Ca.ET.080.04.2.1]RWF26443.1 MAG: hypothetical protein EOS64_01405 [Mesorhizobium sp.]